MAIGTVLIFIFCGLIPIGAVAFAATAVILSLKHTIGGTSYVEYSRYKTEVIEEYECSKSSMEQLIKNLG
ncbi:MAG: hypothetical protein IJ326_03210 [Lachnospiraceae bacterium]|nr:hypothetical protein [Lachnospiraceae bacterium]